MYFIEKGREDFKLNHIIVPGCMFFVFAAVIFVCGWGFTQGQGPIGFVVRLVLSGMALSYLIDVLWKGFVLSRNERLIFRSTLKIQTEQHRKLIEEAAKRLTRRTARGNEGYAEANRLLRMAAIGLAFGLDLDEINAIVRGYWAGDSWTNPRIGYEAIYSDPERKKGGYLSLRYDYTKNRKREPLKKKIKIW